MLPTWQVTLTIPLVSENYPFDGLLSSDTTGTIQVYGDSVDTNSDGFMDILLPDTLSDYPGGLYITLENDLPPITLPEDMFVIPGQDPMELGVGPISLGAIMPDVISEGIQVGPIDTTLYMADMGFSFPSFTNDTIPASTCDDPNARRSMTVNFTFGDADTNINFDQDVQLPGYALEIDYSLFSLTDQGGCEPCGTIPETYICSGTESYPVLAEGTSINIPDSPLPTIRQAFALLPDPSTLPAGVPIESFESVTIDSGSISSIINSQLPLSSSNTGLVVYTKKANGDTTHLHNHFFDELEPYMVGREDDTTRISSLAGVSVYDSLIFEFGGLINGNNGDTLLFPQGVNPFFQYSFSLEINEFRSVEVNMLDTTITTYQPMNTSSEDESGQGFSVEIVSASFKDILTDDADTNKLSINVSNRMGMDIESMEIRLHNFFETQILKDAGVSERITFNLPADSTVDTTVVLDGHILSNTTNDNAPLDSLFIETVVEFSAGDEPTSIPFPLPDDMTMDVGVLMTPLRIADLTGLFDISFEISDQEQPLSLPGLVGGITFGEAILAITMNNEFGVSPGLGLEVKGHRGDDSVVVALNPDSVSFQSGSPDVPVTTEIRISREYVKRKVGIIESVVQHFDDDNNIVNLMAMMPDIVSVGGDAQISPDGLTSITAGAEISGTWRFEIPFLLSVASGVEFMPPNFSKMAALDSSTIKQLVGSNGIPDESDMLISSTINTILYSDIGLGFGMEILVSDIPYFPFYNSVENRILVSADLDLDGAADTLDLNLDTLILHPIVKTLELEIPAGVTDPRSGIVIPGMEGMGQYSYSADFNLDDVEGDSTYGTLKHHKYAFLDTFLLAKSDSGFTDVSSALLSAGLDAPTVADSLYNLELNPEGTELLLMMDVTDYGELGWLIEEKDHYIATKFVLDETPNPALLPFSAGIDVTAFMQFIMNSGPMFGSEADSTE